MLDTETTGSLERYLRQFAKIFPSMKPTPELASPRRFKRPQR